MSTPADRIRALNDASRRLEGDYVLYWMTAQRRTRFNFALQRAVEHAQELGKPLMVFEALRCGYEWACDRFHQFVLEGMVDNARLLAETSARYVAYVEPSHGAGSGVLERLASRACVVVGDDYPAFFLPRMMAATAGKLDVCLEAVDSNGLLPLAAADKAYKRAVDLRRFLQKTLPHHLLALPLADPLAGVDLPECPAPDVGDGRRDLAHDFTEGSLPDLDELPIDHDIAPVDQRGGSEAAQDCLELFLDQRLKRYQEGRMDLDDRSTSELSSYLHFGHLSTHQALLELASREGWQPDSLSAGGRGQREGWWGMSPNAESFLDELVTWRELGFNGCRHMDDFEGYGSLPGWVQQTLDDHRDDEREFVYSLDQFDKAETHDELWNAAQRELVRDGRIHNYLRMVWGKKIFEWSATPEAALDVMIELNNKYAIDGRDPNSYSGIFWCLGRYDRAWGPERPIFGKIRFMSVQSTRRKVKLGDYLDRFSA